ncbi:MAG: hypothetical protein EBY38_09745, partial [Flavobacteriaceae bacterium]|nr:hypothetical protein [Flavobacteriaceae bacterium]
LPFSLCKKGKIEIKVLSEDQLSNLAPFQNRTYIDNGNCRSQWPVESFRLYKNKKMELVKYRGEEKLTRSNCNAAMRMLESLITKEFDCDENAFSNYAKYLKCFFNDHNHSHYFEDSVFSKEKFKNKLDQWLKKIDDLDSRQRGLSRVCKLMEAMQSQTILKKHLKKHINSIKTILEVVEELKIEVSSSQNPQRFSHPNSYGVCFPGGQPASSGYGGRQSHIPRPVFTQGYPGQPVERTDGFLGPSQAVDYQSAWLCLGGQSASSGYGGHQSYIALPVVSQVYLVPPVDGLHSPIQAVDCQSDWFCPGGQSASSGYRGHQSHIPTPVVPPVSRSSRSKKPQSQPAGSFYPPARESKPPAALRPIESSKEVTGAVKVFADVGLGVINLNDAEKNCKSVVIEAVKQDGRALQYASAELKGDR